MKLSDEGRILLAIPLLPLLCLVPAFLVCALLVPALYYLRIIECPADTYLAIKPFLGDMTYDASLVLCVDLVFTSIFAALLIRAYGFRAIVKKFTLLPQAFAVLAALPVISQYNNTQQACIGRAGITYRPTFGRERLIGWRDILQTSVDCVFGSGKNSRLDFRIDLPGGTEMVVENWDLVSNPANRIHYWQAIYDNNIPVKFGVFHKDDPGCWSAFPGLHKPEAPDLYPAGR